MFKKVWILGLLLSAAQVNAAGQEVYVGGGAGYMSLHAGGASTSGLGYGGMLGVKMNPGYFGVGGYFLFAPLTGGGSFSSLGAALDIFPLGTQVLYFGPRLGEQIVSGGGLSLSGFSYGGGGGVNIMLGNSVSVGADANFITGSILNVTVTSISAIGNIKFWIK